MKWLARSPHLAWLVLCAGLCLRSPPLAGASDCNGNGVDDMEDIVTDSDCDADGTPDVCEAELPPFGSLTDVPVTVTSPRVAAADFDADGIVDLAVGSAASGSFGVSLFLGKGERRFQPREDRIPSQREVLSVTAADLDGDGTSDLVTLDAGGLRAYLNTGSGAFGDRLTVSTTDNLSAIEVADLNADGTADIAAADVYSNAVSFFASLSDGTFAELAGHAVEAPAGIALGDIDLDGDVDAVVAYRDGLALCENPGDGILAAPRALVELQGRPRDPVLGDLDGDGLPDVALATDSSLLVLSNRGGTIFEVSTSFDLTVRDRTATAIAIGDSRLVVGVENPRAPGELLFGMAGEGRLRFSLPLGIGATPQAIGTEDLDGDGDGEHLIVTERRDRVCILWNEAGVLQLALSLSLREEVLPLSARFEPHCSALADIDRDGDLDIVTMDGEDQVLVLPNDGYGRFREGDLYRLVGADELIAIVAVDLDNDAAVDIAVIDEATYKLLVLRNEGGGTFRQLDQRLAAGKRPAFLAAGDLDGDGFQDLVSANQDDDTVGVFINQGDATFAPQASLSVGDRPMGVATGDFDGDGRCDIAVACYGSSKLSVFRNQGAGTFGEPAEYELSRPRHVLAADLDADGDLDLAAALESAKRLALLRNDGDGAFEIWQLLDISQTPRSAIAADLNGDGMLDLVSANEAADTISIFLRRPSGAYTPALPYDVGADPRFALAGDLDGDGSLDLIAANHSSFDFTLLFNLTPRSFAPAYLEKICTPLGYHLVSAPAGHGYGVTRTARFLLPIAPGSGPTAFEDVSRYASQREFLASEFPELFPGLTEEEYDRLVGWRETREYFSGGLYRLRSPAAAAYGFAVLVSSPSDPAERLTLEEVGSIHAMLSASFSLSPLVYLPDSPQAREDAASWSDCGFDVVTALFRRGDATGDGSVNIADAIFLLDRLFAGGPGCRCWDAGDANDDGAIDISDAICILLYLFAGIPAIPEPAAGCGWDLTADRLKCVEFPPCEG